MNKHRRNETSWPVLFKQAVAKLYLSLSNERVNLSREQTRVIWSLKDQVSCLTMALFLRSTLSVIVLCHKEFVLPQLIGNSASEALSFPHFPSWIYGKCFSPGQFAHTNLGNKAKQQAYKRKIPTQSALSIKRQRHTYVALVISYSSCEISHQTPLLALLMQWEKPDNYNELNLETTVIFVD